jgi:hypothetical protein
MGLQKPCPIIRVILATARKKTTRQSSFNRKHPMARCLRRPSPPPIRSARFSILYVLTTWTMTAPGSWKTSCFGASKESAGKRVRLHVMKPGGRARRGERSSLGFRLPSLKRLASSLAASHSEARRPRSTLFIKFHMYRSVQIFSSAQMDAGVMLVVERVRRRFRKSNGVATALFEFSNSKRSVQQKRRTKMRTSPSDSMLYMIHLTSGCRRCGCHRAAKIVIIPTATPPWSAAASVHLLSLPQSTTTIASFEKIQ